MNYRSYQDLVNIIKTNIRVLNGYNFELVVGLPRSGMIPAYMISLLLNTHCTDINSFLNNSILKSGGTRCLKSGAISNGLHPHECNKILLVDDSILSGETLTNELAKIPDYLLSKITTLAIYTSRKQRTDINLFLEHVPFPRFFEWNIYHHPLLREACVDIDGVLCMDPSETENDDDTQYLKFLRTAQPFILPTSKIHSLVTSRLEKYRTETEKWLSMYNVNYDNLIMLDLPNKKERQRLRIHAKHKADYYKKSNNILFIESNPNQAVEIFKLSGKAVFCVQNNAFYS